MLLSATEKLLKDANEMRAFYASVGLSEETAERAIKARFNPPAPDEDAAAPRRRLPKPRGRHVRK